MQALLPPPVVVDEAFDDAAPAPLFPSEARVVSRAVPSRRAEFATTRLCARRALSCLGVRPAPLLPDPRGAPCWPPGLVGSLTHCSGYRAAAVASSAEVVALGIDAEPNVPLAADLLAMVAVAEELGGLWRLQTRAADRLLFSAKESVYKAWYPLKHTPLRFHDVTVAFDSAGTFTAECPDLCLEGRWTLTDTHVFTATHVPARPSPPW